MMYYLENSDMFFKLMDHHFDEFSEQLDSIIVFFKLIGQDFQIKSGKVRLNDEIHADHYLEVFINGSYYFLCFNVHCTGFLQRLQVIKNNSLINNYYMGEFIEGVKKFNELIYEANCQKNHYSN